MGDPFSVAGTAVGITSLGIQTFQILYTYYSQYRGFHNDIDNVLRQVEGLQGIVESLRQVKERFEIDNHAPSSQLHLALKACEAALKQLKQMADECSTTDQAADIQTRIRNARKRLLWPFKKDTLSDLQAVLSRFQDNLSLALQSAGLDAMLQRLESLHPMLSNLDNRTVNIQNTLIQHTSVIETLQQETTRAILVQHQHHEDISHGIEKLHAHTINQHEGIVHRLDLLLSGMSSRHPATIPPSLLAESIETLKGSDLQSLGALQAYSSPLHQTNFRKSVQGMYSTCRCRPNKKKSTQRGRWISISSKQEYAHDPDCPRFAHADYTQSVAAQFTVCNRLVGLCIQAGWKNSRSGGWTTIAPVLRYRAVVPRDSGPFKILQDAIDAIFRIYSLERSPERMDYLLSTVSSALQRSFGEIARPNDVDENGDGIMNAVLHLLYFTCLLGEVSTSSIHTLVDTCVSQGVPCDQPNFAGLTPIMNYQKSYLYGSDFDFNRREIIDHTWQYLARTFGNWSVFAPPVMDRQDRKRLAPRLYDMISNMLTLEAMQNCLDEYDPLSLAILRRSEMDLQTCLTRLGANTSKSQLEKTEYTCALASWPRGIESLIVNDILKDSEPLLDILWTSAIRLEYSESVLSLLQCKTGVIVEDWYEACHSWPQWSNDEADNAERARRSQVFDILAHRISVSSDNFSSSPKKPGSHDVMVERPFLYHTDYHLSVLAVESAWKAGFRDLNSVHHGVPPLWTISNHLVHNWSVFWWLVDHGADTTWIHPTLLTTPGHNMARCRATEIEKVSAYMSLIVSEQRDNCTCYCSLKGCFMIGCAVSQMNKTDYPSRRGQDGSFRKTQSRLFALVDDNRASTWMSSAILRVLTFEKLSLTHTCCYRIHDECGGTFTRPTPEEAQIIHDLERDDIHVLDRLVADFEDEWATYTKRFVTFMNRVWRPRMQVVLQEREIDRETYQAELIRMGVTLKESDENQEKDTDSESDSDSDSDVDWPDDYKSEGDGWYTTDEEDVEEDNEGGDEQEDTGGEEEDEVGYETAEEKA